MHSAISVLVLRSLNAITKEATIVAMILGRASPDPGLRPQVELSSSNAGGLRDLLGIGKALPGQRITAEEAPPPLLQIEPTCPSRDEDVVDARMRFEPSARLETVMAAEIIADDEDVAGGIVGFDVGEPRDVALGVA